MCQPCNLAVPTAPLTGVPRSEKSLWKGSCDARRTMIRKLLIMQNDMPSSAVLAKILCIFWIHNARLCKNGQLLRRPKLLQSVLLTGLWGFTLLAALEMVSTLCTPSGRVSGACSCLVWPLYVLASFFTTRAVPIVYQVRAGQHFINNCNVTRSSHQNPPLPTRFNPQTHHPPLYNTLFVLSHQPLSKTAGRPPLPSNLSPNPLPPT